MVRGPRSQIELRECVICVESRPVYRNFPTFTTCDHPSWTCVSCITKHAVTQLEQRLHWEFCTCSQCDKYVPVEELRMAMPRAVKKAVSELIVQRNARSDDAWRWCPKKECGHGEIQRPNHGDPLGNKVSCTRCTFKYCFEHQIPWHEGYDCRSYDLSHPKSEITKSDEETIRTTTKACPGPPGGKGCGWRVEKNGGCPNIFCGRCGTYWNWLQVPFDGHLSTSDAEYVIEPDVYSQR